jgi:ubiquinone/menaquinone biosynthesis C-methylase UbiE
MMTERKKVSPKIELGTRTGYYGPLAASYDEHRFSGALGHLKNWRDQRLVEKAVRHAGHVQRILDVPCGTGRLVRSLASRVPHSVGADVSLDMIESSRLHHFVKNGPKGLLEYVQCDARYLPFSNDCFDVVLSGRFLHHLFRLPKSDRLGVMREFARVSRRWVLGDFNIQYGLKYYMNRVRSILKGKPLKSERMTASKVFEELTEAGLRVERVYPISWVASEKWYILCRKEHPSSISPAT